MSIYGAHEGLTHEDYSAIEAINRGGLQALGQSPAHFRHQQDHPSDKDTPSQLFGRLVHMLILEPHKWKTDVVVSRKYGRTKDEQAAKQAFEDANIGKQIVPQDLYYQVKALAEAALKNEKLCRALDVGETELSLVWRDPETQVDCKARLDLFDQDHIWDIKTTVDAEDFKKSAFSYGYHLHAAWYLRGAKACGLSPLAFRFFAVEKEAPFCHKIYDVSPNVLELANQKLDDLLKRYAYCLANNHWPGYSAAIELLELPAWMASDLPNLMTGGKNGTATATR